MKRIFAVFTLLVMASYQAAAGAVVFAQAPLPPAAPTAPVAPPGPSDTTVEPTPPPAPTAPPAPDGSESSSDPAPTPTPTSLPDNPVTSENSSDPVPAPTSSPTAASTTSDSSPSPESSITTGDATTSGIVISQANTNIATDPVSSSVSDSPSGIQVVNSDNGAQSQNTGSVTVDTASAAVQDNQAAVDTNLTLDSTTGHNETSLNSGTDSNITTGDANVSGTSISALNTNIDGVMVSEFNIDDTHEGDYVLDFAANCISGCFPGSVDVANTGNGADSSSTADVTAQAADNTFQNNDAAVGNTMILAADSGYNTAALNTNGDSNITTGDANVSASALTFANNNLSGNVVYGVVNIYGDLIGDIILPEEILDSCCLATTGVANTENGASSQNTADVSVSASDATFQTNEAVIENQLVLDANTGANSASGNTGGGSSISTGDSTAVAQVINVANSNIDGGNWWLVLVNQAGQWVGQILGAPAGVAYAGSNGTQFQVGANGEITAVNSGNGAGSANTATVSSSDSHSTVQTNSALVANNLQLTANTGHNSTSYNTGGDSNIQTGDAQIVANIVNFVNNNITGGGKLFVTVVNVFGSWVGDFVTPGAHKNEPPTGGDDVNPVAQSDSDDDESDQNGDEDTGSDTDVDSEEEDENTAIVYGPVSPRRPPLAGTSQVLSAQSSSEPETLAALDIPSARVGKKVVRLNLAWLLLALPLFFGFRLIRRRFLLAK